MLLELIIKKLKDYIYKLKINNPSIPTYILVDMVRKEIGYKFGEVIREFVVARDYDQFRITNSLAIRSFKAVK